jgi:hypothetical protein
VITIRWVGLGVMQRQGLLSPAEASRPILTKARQIWTHVAPEAVKMQ